MTTDGAVDWLCWPRFDSPSLFGALLDRKKGGSWIIRPAGPASASCRYLQDTNVLETRFQAPGGIVLLTDFMPAVSEEAKRRLLLPEHELIRRIECLQGFAEVRIHFLPRPDYARVRDAVRNAGPFGFRIERGGGLFTLRSEPALRLDAAGGVSGVVRLRAGQSAALSLSYAADGPAVLPPLGRLAQEKLAASVDWWRRWAGRARYDGPHRGAVVRSALALKLLSYAPSGAILAAPTTSLPERLGGDMNWDYRFCWLRDAAFTSRALHGLGYREEAEAFVSWLLHATRLTRPELRILYDVFGERGPCEAELTHLRGYAGSRPVRIGNTARDQVQLDVITGASAGVGRATARVFARRGAAIGLLARGADGLEATRADVERLGGRALAIPTSRRGRAAAGRAGGSGPPGQSRVARPRRPWRARRLRPPRACGQCAGLAGSASRLAARSAGSRAVRIRPAALPYFAADGVPAGTGKPRSRMRAAICASRPRKAR